MESVNYKVFSSGLKLYLQDKHNYVYPDAMVICGKIETAQEESNAVTNPTLIVEVLSKSTASYDRGDKFKFYRQVPSLQEYVLIEQESATVDVFYRTASTHLWQFTSYEDLDNVVHFQSIDIEIPMKGLYQDVVWG